MPRPCICEEAEERKAKFWFCPMHGPQHRHSDAEATQREPSREFLEIIKGRRRVRRVR